MTWRAGGLQRFFVSATEGSLEFVVILAHWCKLFHGRSLKFVFGRAQDLIIGLAKLESFHGQLFWSKVKFRNTQSTTKSDCSEKSQGHDDSFDCHCLIWLFAICFDCWLKLKIKLLMKRTISDTLYTHDFLSNTAEAPKINFSKRKFWWQHWFEVRINVDIVIFRQELLTCYTKKFLTSTLTTSAKTEGIKFDKYQHLCHYLCHWHLKAFMLYNRFIINLIIVKPIQYRRRQIWLRQTNPIKTVMSETRDLLLRLIWLRRFKQLGTSTPRYDWESSQSYLSQEWTSQSRISLISVSIWQVWRSHITYIT